MKTKQKLVERVRLLEERLAEAESRVDLQNDLIDALTQLSQEKTLRHEAERDARAWRHGGKVRRLRRVNQEWQGTIYSLRSKLNDKQEILDIVHDMVLEDRDLPGAKKLLKEHRSLMGPGIELTKLSEPFPWETGAVLKTSEEEKS